MRSATAAQGADPEPELADEEAGEELGELDQEDAVAEPLLAIADRARGQHSQHEHSDELQASCGARLAPRPRVG